MTIDFSRRFYKEAAAVPVPGGWGIALDGKRVKTPARRDLILASRPLAEAIAAEWSAQESRVRPSTMPLMQLASTTIDRVGPERARVVAETAAYAATDLVCYRAVEPPDLVARQVAVWDPLIAWLRERFDVTLQVTTGITVLRQSESALSVLSRVVAGQEDFHLTALATLAGASGSLVVALAVLEGRLGPQDAAAASQLDELFQVERWGIDGEAEKRREAQREDMVCARRFLDLLAAGAG